MGSSSSHSSGLYNYCSADNFSSKYNSGFAFGSKHGGQVGLVGGVVLGGAATGNFGYAMAAGSFGQAVGNEFGDIIGGYGGYGVAAFQCGAQVLGQSMANSGGGMLMHF
ncbi:hypothetical protein [Bartonella tribocorum]|uniref:Uncharacterized protein n=1 Tax=Bartonella tribocorum (strain DSM 28219 / CCUG 45778 / CIP 105476 / IBS 506) TaxID=382640 RepID=A9IQ84_BART1|nr:hypothetical protein [Bartonella tribocorum]CAK01024.1 hypothetical protein predicted by Glimmer/Critica [Bartonella tribocorum CIP 105476]CDO48230.1 hypothetical protein BM1374166_00541 [Bartonella tribocorum]